MYFTRAVLVGKVDIFQSMLTCQIFDAFSRGNQMALHSKISKKLTKHTTFRLKLIALTLM